MKKKTKSDLYALPNIGPKSVAVLAKIGIRSIADLKRGTPESIFSRLCKVRGFHQHPAMLYVLRSAFFWLKNPHRRKEALMWWMFR
jgi:hypothetical protein